MVKYQVDHHIVSIHHDDYDASFAVRRNGKVFYIYTSPSRFSKSPLTTKKYFTYVDLLKSGEEEIDNVYDTDVYEWLIGPFEPFFLSLAPDPAPEYIATTKFTLQQSLFPEFFVFELDVIDEVLAPRRVPRDISPRRPSFVRLDEDLLDDLAQWSTIYDPANVIVNFENPEDALFKEPRKVLIDNAQIECFFKPCYSPSHTECEVLAYKTITTALRNQPNICKFHGLVKDDHEFIVGLLLSYIDCRNCPLSMRVTDDPTVPPVTLRRKWMDQIDTALATMHQHGAIWGDVKAENVLIDENNDAWIADFGGSYTEGWVDKSLAGTLEGDKMGMANMKKLLFPFE